ncbi:winged helix-turn-helix domain-containing protein, partial [Salmonella enterica subsp. enterica serovar Kentucky]|nr:winged helix-turn-helix domain-containing protein [Salmonella enterica subsp. enterica serovar Kentucky]
LRGVNYDGLDRSVDVAISRLRKKLLDSAAEPYRIKTIRNKGYDRVHLSSYFSHHTAEELSLVREGFYEKHGVKVLVGERAITI